MGSLLRVPDVKNPAYAPEGLALQMCGTGTTQMIKSFMLSEKKHDMNPIPPDLRMFFHLSILVFLGTECTLYCNNSTSK